MELINIGYGSVLSARRVVAMISPDSAPIKRLVQESRERACLIDASFGRRTQTVITTDSGHVVLSALDPETLAARAQQRPQDGMQEQGERE